jgi:hypothetical protein
MNKACLKSVFFVILSEVEKSRLSNYKQIIILRDSSFHSE